MDKKRNLLGIFLAATAGTTFLIAIFIRAFYPQTIIPRLGIPAIVLISVIALILDCYIVKGSLRIYWFIPIYSALIFGLFPYAACFMPLLESAKTAVLGGVIFTLVTLLFDLIIKRISIGSATKLAPIIGGFGIYLASLGLMGIF